MKLFDPVASAFAILTETPPPIRQMGNRFLTRGNFTLMGLMQNLSKGFDIGSATVAANRNAQKGIEEIQIPLPPPEISEFAQRAWIGGVYHECFHVLWSTTDKIDRFTMASLWHQTGAGEWFDQVRHLAPLVFNIVEDIRIESQGMEFGPGVEQKLWCLAELILSQEDQQQRTTRERTDLEEGIRIYREMGFGYPVSQRIVEDAKKTALWDKIKHLEGLALRNREIRTDREIVLHTLTVLRDLCMPLLDSQDPPDPPDKDKDQDEDWDWEDDNQDPRDPPSSPLSKEIPADQMVLSSQSALGALQDEMWRHYSGQKVVGETPWRPLCMDLDQHLVPVAVSDLGNWLTRARKDSGYLGARFANLFRAMEPDPLQSGAQEGDLDPDLLVECYTQIRAGSKPYNPFIGEGEEIDTSLSCCILIDQSMSMNYDKINAALLSAVTLQEALGQVGGRTQITGFSCTVPLVEAPPYSRITPVELYHYKTFDEEWTLVRNRLTALDAIGGTPMADALMEGLTSLQTERSRYRLLILLTDGLPNDPKVTRWAIRKIRKERIGLLICGMQMDQEALEDLHDRIVCCDDLTEFTERTTELALRMILEDL